ncbi:MAG: hypothetical protein GPJ54_07430 [Candidatus Heimdallarchaeota archaeon]|nr:hypothetical protein [Candidatus Heimdallarchaeota archaeon]
MILSGKKYSSKGRIRYGSSLFIDDSDEQITDSIRGYTRNSSIKYVLILLIILKLVTGNVIGLFVAIFVFYTTYILSVRNLHIQFTNERLLVISEFRHQRLVYMLGYVSLGISFYVLLNFIFPKYYNSSYNLQIIEFFFEFFHFLPVFYVVYSQIIIFYESILIRLDSLITFIVYFVYGIQFLKMKYHFQEIHYSHVTEEIIKLKKDRNPILLPFIILTSIYAQVILFNGFSLVTSLIFAVIYVYATNRTIAKLSLFGSYGKPLLDNVHLLPTEFFRTTRATASIFGWEHQGNYYSRPFPYNVIPKEVASNYETGLRASTIDALKQANGIGLVFSGFTNLFVILLLFKFAFENNREALPTVILICVGLILISYLVWQITSQFAKYQYKAQAEESLMIGRNFIGRYIEPNLWIVRGSKLEGTRLQRGVKTRTVRYDRTRGLQISWQSISLNVLIILLIIITGIWIQLGALNIGNFVYIFPFVIDQSLNFINDKASAELGFFILAGYVFWAILYFNYPKYYARSRPQLFLEMQYPRSIPIILKNFKEHQDASIQFTKCLINSSRPMRRKTKGRPGIFQLQILLESIELHDKELSNHVLSFFFGEIQSKGESVILGDYGSIKLALIDQLRVSGELGFPRLLINTNITGSKFNSKLEETFDLEINGENKLIISVENKLTISLSVKIKSMAQ